MNNIFLLISDAVNPSPLQWEALLRLMDEEMLHGPSSHNPNGKAKLMAKWEVAAKELNTLEGATAVKTADQWKAVSLSLL